MTHKPWCPIPPLFLSSSNHKAHITPPYFIYHDPIALIYDVQAMILKAKI